MNIKTPHTTLKSLAIAVLLATSTLTTSSHAFDIRERPYEKVSGTAVNDKLGYELRRWCCLWSGKHTNSPTKHWTRYSMES